MMLRTYKLQVSCHPAGMVLPFSSAASWTHYIGSETASNVTTKIGDRMHMCGGFVYFVVNGMSYFSISGPGPLLFFCITPIK